MRESIEELHHAFDLVERSSPGITDELLEEILSRIAGQTMTDREVHAAMDRMKGYVPTVTLLGIGPF